MTERLTQQAISTTYLQLVDYPALQRTQRMRRPHGAVPESPAVESVETQLLLQQDRHQAFVATLSHELRQPLSVIASAVEVLRLAPGSPQAARAMETIHRQTHQMHRLVDDLTEAARWAVGQVPLQLVRFDLCDLVTDAVQDAAADAAARGHVLLIVPALEPFWVDADRQRLQQVMSNLLGNAIKYTDAGGCITVTMARLAETVTVSVSDTGRGLAPQALTHIFDMFSQVLPAEGAGLGIGLSVARDIVSRHHGLIAAHSAGIGLGSTFTVGLPTVRQSLLPLDA